MNLDELRSVQNKERQTDSLQHLRESFYGDVSVYITELEDERDGLADEVEDPFGNPDVRRLSDEIDTAREVVEAIYQRRLGKLVKRASLTAAADTPADDDGLTAEERDLFEDLVDRIEANKAHVLDVIDEDAHDGGADTQEVTHPDDVADHSDHDDVIAEEARAVTEPGDADLESSGAPDRADPDRSGPEAPSDDDGDGPPTDHDSPDNAARSEASSSGESGTVDDETDAPGESGLDDRTTVRITGDVDEFYGVDDREYDLDPETVVTLPAANAEPLLHSGDAERLD